MKRNETPQRPQKQRSVSNIQEADKKHPVWDFSRIDKNGPFAFNLNFDCRKVLDKLINYSSMTWAEIKRQTHDNGKSKHHMLSYKSLSKEAMDRLKKLHIDAYEEGIFSFALENKIRIIGIREHEVFKILWYDPEHEVCPSNLK